MNEQIFQELKNQSFRQIIDKCTYLKKISNSLFGDSELILHKMHNVQLLLITRIYNRKEQISKLIQETQLRQTILSDKILRIIAYNVKEVNELCGTFYRVQWIYEFYGHTLYDNIQYRKKKNLNFTDFEIMTTLESILMGFQKFKSLSIRHGYFQPKHIIQNNKSLQLLISDIRFMTQNFEFQTFFNSQQQTEECYLSPELLKELQKGVIDNSTNYEKNEIFSIGLTLLECMLLQYPKIYDLPRFAVNQQKLQQHLDLMESKYQTIALVREMLLIDIYLRPSLEQVISLLAQFRYKISLKSPVSQKSNYILQIDQSKENVEQETDIYSPFSKKILEITPIRNQEYKSIKKQQLTPVTHLSRSPVSVIKPDNSFLNDSLDASNKTIDLSINQNPYNFTYRPTTPEQKTKPCPSPFKQNNLNSQREESQTISQISSRSSNQAISSYDFVFGIKLDVPSSLKEEFYKLETQIKYK